MTITELKAAYRLAASLGETNLDLGELSDGGCNAGAFLDRNHSHCTRSLGITKAEIIGVLTNRRESLLQQLFAMGVYPDPLPAEIEPAPAAVPFELELSPCALDPAYPPAAPEPPGILQPAAEDEILF